jgi:flagellar hook protein FlgE
MYLAICKRDKDGRLVLTRWEPYGMQEMGTNVPGHSGEVYSNVVTDEPVDPDSGTFVVTDQGALEKIKDYHVSSTTDSNLQNAKERKTSLVNQMFETLIRQVIPSDYLSYLQLIRETKDIETEELYDWFTRVNEYRINILRSIDLVEQAEDLDNISIDLSGYDQERPNVLLQGLTPDHIEYIGVRRALYDEEVMISNSQKIELFIDIEGIPYNGVIISGYSDNLNGKATNYSEELQNVVPLSILFRLSDGSALGASEVLQRSVNIPEDLVALEFTITKGYMIRYLGLSLESEQSSCRVETVCGTVKSTGQHVNVILDCNADKASLYVEDSATIGPLSIVVSSVSPVAKKERIDILPGTLDIDLHEYTTSYIVYDSNGYIVYQGYGPGKVDDLRISDKGILEFDFTNTETVEIVEWSLTPDVVVTKAYDVDITYNELTKSMTVYNNTGQDINGKLVFEMI